MNTKIKKAVFPIAGLGSRFLPATKANPKEMLPIVDKPLIHYAVEEAIAAGITDLVFITSSSKHAIEDYFDTNFELETRLEQQSKNDLLTLVKNILPENVNCMYIRQPQPLGLGDAVLRAYPVVGDQPFAVLLADDLIDCGSQSCLQQMCAVYEEIQSSVIAVEKIKPEQTDKYGVIAVDETYNVCHRINAIVEKPKAKDAPSNLGVAGRYILTPEIFNCLRHINQGIGGELQLTDAISLLLKTQSAYGLEFVGKRYDCGSKLGYLQATVQYALNHTELAEDFKSFLKDIIL
jgi:UTP--glucose-1-phosphate uridylyltransferase